MGLSSVEFLDKHVDRRTPMPAPVRQLRLVGGTSSRGALRNGSRRVTRGLHSVGAAVPSGGETRPKSPAGVSQPAHAATTGRGRIYLGAHGAVIEALGRINRRVLTTRAQSPSPARRGG